MRRGISSRMGRHFAFSLIELLVVVAIMSLLIALALPALSRARDQARVVKCLSNMRQLLAATNLYVNENGFYYPQPFEDKDLTESSRKTGLWFNALDTFLGRVGADYSAGHRHYDSFKQDPVWSTFGPADREKNRTIKMNESFGHRAPQGTVRFARDGDVDEPSLTVVYVDGRAYDIREVVIALRFSALAGSVGLRHADGANVAFADGHVALENQEIRFETAAPSWFVDPDPRQDLRWDLHD